MVYLLVVVVVFDHITCTRSTDGEGLDCLVIKSHLSSGPEPPLHLMGQNVSFAILLFDHDTALLI